MKRLKAPACLAAALVLASCGQAVGSDSSKPEAVVASVLPQPTSLEVYIDTVAKTDFCAHALGAINGDIYTNSLEALWKSYEGGARIFEADIHLTSDGQAVLVHGFAKNDYLKRIGEEYYPEKNKKSGEDYIPAHDEFMSFKIQGKYHPLDFKMLADFIREHDDMYVLTDTWAQDYEGTRAVYTAMAEACGYEEAVLSHIIAGGHTREMIEAVKSVYDFELLNLYYSDEIISDEFTADDFISYCKEQGITSISCADSYYTPEHAEALEGSGLITYVFTVNDEERARVLLALGVDVIGSDIFRD